MKDSSDAVKRREGQKLEEEFQFLRKKLIVLGGIDPSKDIKPLQDLFVTNVEDMFNASQKWFISALKDSPQDSSLSPPQSSSMKKEPVGLPDFKGNESHSPFLKYLIWQKEWAKVIVQYPES